jgi:hypothetical protein
VTPFGKSSTENTYTYEGKTVRDVVTAERITVRPAIKIDPDPKAKFKIEVKDIKGSGEVFFDNKTGRVIESSISQRMEVQLSAAGLILTKVIEQTTTLRLKRK